MNGEKMAVIISTFRVSRVTMRALLFSFFLCLANVSLGHEFFFAYAEVKYNDVSRMFETTIVATTHDVERALEAEEGLHKELNFALYTDDDIAKLLHFLEQHFRIEANAKCPYQIIGFETMSNGITNFYLESEPCELGTKIEWHFDLLMTHFKEQQNKITFYFRETQSTLLFTPITAKQTLKLEND